MLTDLSSLKIGNNVKIYPMAKIIHNGSNLDIGDYAQIDDFVFINAGKYTKIGRFTHIASFVSIIGGGELVVEDFSGFSAGCRVVTGSDDYTGGFLAGPAVPDKFKNVKVGKVVLQKYVIIGSNAVIMPNVVIGEGATVGAGCIVTKDLEPWGIYAGFATKKVGERDKQGVLDREKELLGEIIA